MSPLSGGLGWAAGLAYPSLGVSGGTETNEKAANFPVRAEAIVGGKLLAEKPGGRAASFWDESASTRVHLSGASAVWPVSGRHLLLGAGSRCELHEAGSSCPLPRALCLEQCCFR